MNFVLQLQSVTKRYGAQTAVDDITVGIRKGEFFSLIGPSGCGKTTTLRLIAGFEELSEGAIELNGRNVVNDPPHRRDVSTVFQNYALFPHLTVAQNVAFGLEQRNGISRAETKKRVSEMLALLELSGKERRLPKQLSGGERQRVALARSLVLRPSVLLLDEPLSALDPKLRRHVRTELKALQGQVGVAFLFVTHDQEEALALSDRIGVMHQGRLLQVGPGAEVYRGPATRFVAEFLGDVNWMSSGCGIRPEALRVYPTARERCMPAVVEEVEFLGSRLRLRAQFDNGGSCTAEMSPNGFIPVCRQAVWITWEPDDEIRGLDA